MNSTTDESTILKEPIKTEYKWKTIQNTSEVRRHKYQRTSDRINSNNLSSQQISKEKIIKRPCTAIVRSSNIKQDFQDMLYKKTHKNLSILVDGMFKQFQETIPLVTQIVDTQVSKVQEKIIVRPSTAKNTKRIDISIQRNLNFQRTFQAEFKQRKRQTNDEIDLPTKPEQIDVVDTRENMLQALLVKLDISQLNQQIMEPLIYRKATPQSTFSFLKRSRAKFSMHQPTKPNSDKNLASKSFDQISNRKFDSKERYQLLEILGTGAQSKVNKAKDTLTDKFVAIKQYERNNSDIFGARQLSFHEIKTLQKLDHPCIIKLINVVQSRQSISLVLEYHGKQSLYMVLKGKTYHRFTEDAFKPIFLQIVKAVEYCHQQGVVHRDIKIENILLNKAQIKLIDFGLAAKAGKTYLSTYCGTPSYMSPEVCSRRPYKGEKSDIWALGIVLYVSLCGKFPFEGKNDEELFKAIIGQNLKLPGYLSAEVRKLITIILDKDSSKRLTATEILQNKWIMELF